MQQFRQDSEEDEVQPRVLFVDDDKKILGALQRMLFEDFEVHTAESGIAALSLLQQETLKFAVIVSDMRMPSMNGAEFLAKARELALDSTRILLTGQADLPSAIAAINEGQIFRFLTKPCSPEHLMSALRDGVRQHELLLSERELLGQTLHQCVSVLTELLGVLNPAAFARGNRVKAYVTQMTHALGLPDAWQYELAGMLCQIGCTTLSQEIIEKLYEGSSLTEYEADAYREHAGLAHHLLRRIPRLGDVALMIRDQAADLRTPAKSIKSLAPAEAGALLLRAALELDALIVGGMPRTQAIEKFRSERQFPIDLLVALGRIEAQAEKRRTAMVALDELREGMSLAGEVRTTTGVLLATIGQEVSEIMRRRLARMAARPGVVEPVRVIVPVAQPRDVAAKTA